MQVKKFEAKTMQEALVMIKQELGPDAVILSARDNKRGFGLLDSGSVEVTAAVSEKTLIQRKVAEKKIKTSEIERFRNSPAALQKKFINKVSNAAIPRPTKAPTSRPYVDIADDESGENQADVRIKSAVQRAWDAMNETSPATPQPAQYPAAAQRRVPPKAARVDARPAPSAQQVQISNLENEVRQLKGMLQQFRKLPEMLNQSSYPGSDVGLRYEFSKPYQKLMKAGVSSELISSLLTEAQDRLALEHIKKPAFVEAWLVKRMMDQVLITPNPYGSWIHCFVGAPGSGKTFSLIKMASDLVVNRKKKVAILTCDTHKVGAVEQMRIFAQILNVPFGTISPDVDWFVLREKLRAYDNVLIDFPGLKLNSPDQVEFMQSIMPPSELRTVHMVSSLASKDVSSYECIRRYQALNFDDGIFTNLDQASHFGFLYNFCSQFSKPLHSFGIGPNVPEDFEYATRERVMDLIFDISKRWPAATNEGTINQNLNGGAIDGGME